jgi:hypothetical protein
MFCEKIAFQKLNQIFMNLKTGYRYDLALHNPAPHYPTLHNPALHNSACKQSGP